MKNVIKGIQSKMSSKKGMSAYAKAEKKESPKIKKMERATGWEAKEGGKKESHKGLSKAYKSTMKGKK